MSNKNIKILARITALLTCIIFCFIALQSTMLSLNTSHLNKCGVEKCSICKLIQYAINFTQNINYKIQYTDLLNAIIPLSCIFISKVFEGIQTTLIKLNVRLNE